MTNNFNDAFILDSDKPTLRVCSYCFKENNLDRKLISNIGWMISDGICVRHMSDVYKTAGFDDALIQQALKRVESDPNFTSHCRDLFDPKNKPFLDWLKNPTASPTQKSF